MNDVGLIDGNGSGSGSVSAGFIALAVSNAADKRFVKENAPEPKLLNDRQLFQANELHVKTLAQAGVCFNDVSSHVIKKEDLVFEFSQLMETAREDQVTIIQGNPDDRNMDAFGDAVVRDARRQQLARILSL